MKTALQTIASAATSGAAGETAGDAAFRQAPHNIEAEQALLGAILRNNETQDRVSAFLLPEHFFEPLHARIFDTASKLITSGKQATPITLKTFFENEEPIGDLPVPQYLVRLAANTPTIINAMDYGQTIYDLAVRRQLIVIGEDMVNVAYDSPIEAPPQTQIEESEQRLYNLAETGKYGQGFETFETALVSAVEMASAAYQRDGGLSGISCGISSLDSKLGGLQPSDLLVIAARPSMGKTALVTNLAYNVAFDRLASQHKYPDAQDPDDLRLEGGVVGFFSLEMSSEQLATRLLSAQAEVPSEKIRRGMITEDEFKNLSATAKNLAAMPLYLDDTGGLSIAQISARARRLKRQKGLGLLIIDYIQLLSGTAKTASQGRVQEVTEITTGLKALAKELNVPIIACSQLSRQVEQREDKRPQLSDLRESGSIEQDADAVMFIFREEYYLDRAQPREGTPEYTEWQAKIEPVRNLAEIIIAKQRHGPTGTVALRFDGNTTSYVDLEQKYTPEAYG